MRLPIAILLTASAGPPAPTGYMAKILPSLFRRSSSLLSVRNESKSGARFSPSATPTWYTLWPASLKLPLVTSLASPVVTAKLTSVFGTFRFSKVPLMLSLPPIPAQPLAFCASSAPSSAAAGLPQLSSSTARPKNSWNDRRHVSGSPPMHRIFRREERTAYCAPCHGLHSLMRGS